MFAYFLPAFIAAHRKHSRALWILVLNLLAGWTFLAWLLALAWAMSKKRTETVALAESLINVECESQPSTAASSGAHRGLRRFLR
ncbi:MAG: superinfection immunity protein [Magnetospirillum sp.]|nr:superinfection immunity protein [Magnetospirillum sp.]